MIIIAIAWLYVALMLSIGASSLIGAVLTFVGWGPLPLAIVWYIFGRKRHKQQSPDNSQLSSLAPDQAGHASSDTITAVREESPSVANRA
jgi:hypothetical protein